MADPPGYPDSGDHTGRGSERRSANATPLWVKVFGVVALVLVLVFVILLLIGSHGPGRHGVGGPTSPPGVPAHAEQQP